MVKYLVRGLPCWVSNWINFHFSLKQRGNARFPFLMVDWCPIDNYLGHWTSYCFQLSQRQSRVEGIQPCCLLTYTLSRWLSSSSLASHTPNHPVSLVMAIMATPWTNMAIQWTFSMPQQTRYVTIHACIQRRIPPFQDASRWGEKTHLKSMAWNS